MDRLQKSVLVMVLLNGFATPLMLSSVNVALPDMADALALSAISLSWVQMIYLMASAMFVMQFGSLADRLGRKRVFLYGTGAVVVTSVLAALSVNGTMLLSARFLQGAASAALAATQVALVSSVFAQKERGQMIGLLVASIYIGLAAGPLIGGFVIDAVGWRWVFLLQIPLALVVLVLGIWRVPGEWAAQSRSPYDAVGSIGYSFAILLLCLAVSRMPALDGFVLLLAGVLCMTYVVRHALRSPAPFWDMRLFFSNRVFSMSCGASLIMYSATYANVVLISLFLQYLKGIPASQAGMIMMVQPLTMAVLSPLAGRLSDRLEPRLLASCGMAVTALGLASLASLTSSSSLTAMVLALLLTGVGFSLFSSPNVNAIMSSVEPRLMGSASGAVATMRLLGQLTSMVLVTLMLTLLLGDATITTEQYPQLERSIRLSLGLAALLCVPGIAMSLARGRLRPSP